MINIYIDTTGSMIEMGKNSAVLYIAKSIQDYCAFNSIETSFYQLDGTKILDLESMKYSNDIAINFKDCIENSIILSDGLFPLENKTIFDIAISIGIDADLDNLKIISKKVFTNDELLSALEFLLFHNTLQLDIIEDSKEEDNDEW